MFKNYIKISGSSLMRNKVFSGINLLVLTIGVIGAVLLLLWRQNELAWNNFQPDANTTYQGMVNRNLNEEAATNGALLLPLAKNIESLFPQVNNAAFTAVVKPHNNFEVKATGVTENVPGAFTMQFYCNAPFNYHSRAAADWLHCYTQLVIQTADHENEAAMGKEFSNLAKKQNQRG